MILNSGATNIKGITPFAVGSSYQKYDIVYFSGYTNAGTEIGCTPAQSGHYYYSGNNAQTSTVSNTPVATDSNWTQSFYFEPSYGTTVDYQTSYYGVKFGDGYFNLLNRSENALKVQFSVPFEKRTDRETKALLHLLDDSFNKGELASGGYTGIQWTPFEPYDLEARFFVENFSHNYEAPDINTVSTTFFNETKSLTDWQSFAIPWSGTRQKYNPTGQKYYQHDMAFLTRTAELLTPAQSGWYYFTGEAPSTGISSDDYNSPTGNGTLWTKDNFYFDVEQGLELQQSPRFSKQELHNDFYVRMKDGLNKNLLTFSLKFTGRTDKEAKAMVHFLEHHRGSDLISFTLPDPYNFTDKVFICQKWTHTLKFKDNNDIRVDFLEFPINYLSRPQQFNTLITVVNRPVQGVSGPGSPFVFDGGSVSTVQRRQGDDFVGNTGLGTYIVTGFSMRTGFYLTNSGAHTLETRISRKDTSSNPNQPPFKAFEFPSGIDDPIIIKPGDNAFIPFYFNGLMDNISGPSSYSSTGPFNSGSYVTTLQLTSTTAEDGVSDISGPITMGITGYITGWPGAGGNPYRGHDGDNPGHPEKFLVKTGLYDSSSGYARNFLKWEVPATGYYATRYYIQHSDNFSNWTGVDYVNVNYKTVTDLDPVNNQVLTTRLYTGAMVPPSLAREALEDIQGSALPGPAGGWLDGPPYQDPHNTGIRQSSTYMHTGDPLIAFNKDYYYRIRAEFQPIDTPVSGSMWVYASGTNDLNGVVSTDVSTGLTPDSDTYTQARVKIPTGPKQPLVVYLNHLQSNVNLSGLFNQALIDRNMVQQTLVSPGYYIDTKVPETGIYGENFTGVQYVMPQNVVVGAETTTQVVDVKLGASLANAATTMTIDPVKTLLENGDIVYFGDDTFTLDADASAGDTSIGGVAVVASSPLANGTEGTCSTNLGAIENGYQLITGVVQPADAGPTNANTQKPLAETPTILVMKAGSSVVGKGGDGGDGGYTCITTTEASDEPDKAGLRYNTPQPRDAACRVSAADPNCENAGIYINPKVGNSGGDAIRITHKDISKFQIQKDYRAMIYSGGGGGGAGDRFNAQAGLTLTDTKGAATIYVARTPEQREVNTQHAYRNYATMPEHMETAILGIMGNIKDEDKSSWEKLVLNSITPQGTDSVGMDGWSISASDLAGNHYGGAGGGGQGFSNQNNTVGIFAEAGKMPKVKGDLGQDTILVKAEKPHWLHTAGIGTLAGYGGGFTHPTIEQYSAGGDGGSFGAQGLGGELVEGLDLFGLDVGDGGGKAGGLPGDAIRVLDYSGTKHYTAANYRGKLLSIGPRAFEPSDIEGLVAQFDAQAIYDTGTATQSVKTVTGVGTTWEAWMVGSTFDFTGGSASAGVITGFTSATEMTVTVSQTVAVAEAYELSNVLDGSGAVIANNTAVKKWTSKNDPNVYLEQTTAGSRPKFFAAGGGSQPGSGTTNPSPLTDEYFNAKNYVYFQPLSASTADYFELTGGTKNDVTVNANAKEGATSLTVASLGTSLVSGTTVYFENNTKFTLTSNATASGSPVTLTGKLYGADIAKGNKGWMKLSSIMDSFEIFYMFYPDKWIVSGTGDSTGLVFAPTDGVTLFPTYKTGFTRFSDLNNRTMSQYYGRRTKAVQETMGLAGTSMFNFYDWIYDNNAVRLSRYRAWCYNLRAVNKGAALKYEAANDGRLCGGESFAQNQFNFMTTPIIGASQVSVSNQEIGFHGAIAEILIYSRALTQSERRSVNGYLMNKYLKMKTLDATSNLIDSTNNLIGVDRNGVAGPIHFK